MDEIIINTKIDTSGIDEGIDAIEQKLAKIRQATMQLGASMEDSFGAAGSDFETVMNSFGERMETFITDFSEGFVEGFAEEMNKAAEGTRNADSAMSDLLARWETNTRAIANTTANIEELLGQTKAMGKQEKKVSFLATALGKVGRGIKGIGQRLSGPASKIGSFVKKFLSIAGAIAIFRKLTSTIKGAMSSLEGWGTTTSRVISDYKKSMEFLQNAMGAMFAPIIDTVLPRISALLDRIAEGFNTLGMYIAALMGKTSYTKAVKGVNDYKDAIAKTGQAADKAAGSLASFDELTIIDTGNNDQQQNPFTTEGIPEEIQQIKSLKDLLESIDWKALGENGGEFVNSLVSNIKDKIEKFPAETLGESMRTFTISFLEAVDFNNMGDTFGELVGKIADGIKAYFSPDEEGKTVVGVLAQSVKDFLIGALDGIPFEDLGITFGTVANAIVDGIITFFDPKENIFSKMVQGLYDFIDGALDTLDYGATRTAISNVAQTITGALETAVKDFPAGNLAQSLSDFIWNAISGITDGLEDFDPIDFIDGITDKIIEFVENIKWFEVAGALLKAVTTIVTMIPEILLTMVDTPIRLMVNGLSDFLYNVGEKMAQSNIPWIKSMGEDIKGFALDIQDAYDTASSEIKDAVHTAMSDARKDANDTIDEWVADQEIAYQKTQAAREYDKTHREMMKNQTVGITQEEAMELERIRQEGVESVRNAEREKADLMTQATKDTATVIDEENDRIQKSYKERWTTEKTGTDETVRVLHGYSQEVDKVTGEVISANHGAGVSFGELERTTSEKVGAMHSSVVMGAAGIQNEVSSKFKLANDEATAELANMSLNTSSEMSAMLSTIQTDVGSMSSTMGNELSNMSSDLVTKMDTMSSDTSTKFESIVTTIRDKMASASSDVTDKLASISTGFSTKMEGVLTTVRDQMGNVLNTMNGQDWGSVGSNMVSGIVNGLNSGWTWLSNSVASVAANALATAKSVLGIRSPSRVFRDEVGAMISEGMAIGIDDEADAPQKALMDVVSGLTDTAVGAIQGPSIASGAFLPTQIAGGIANGGIDGQEGAISIEEILGMIRQVRDNQQDLLETLIEVVRDKRFTFTPNASAGRVINESLKAYRAVTG